MDAYVRRSAFWRSAVLAAVIATSWAIPAAGAIYVWEKQELTFTSAGAFANPYTDAVVWVDLTGPHFQKRVYGFWDGDHTFRVRLVATQPGLWQWTSGSMPQDGGASRKKGLVYCPGVER